MRRAPRATWRPLLERLEDRLAPAVSLVTSLDLDLDGDFDDVRIVGDARSNRVVMSDQPGTDRLIIAIDANNDGDLNDGNDVNELEHIYAGNSLVIDVSLGDGNDRFTYLQAENLDGQLRTVSVNLGRGNDTLFASDAGHGIVDSQVVFDVVAGQGNDNVAWALTELLASSVTWRASLGGGNDSSALDFVTVDEQTVLKIDVDLGTGNNDFNSSFGAIGQTVGANVDLDLVGGDDATHKDDIAVQFLGPVGNVTGASHVTLDAALFAGNDHFVTTLGGGVGNGSQLAIAAGGGAGNDTLEVNLSVVVNVVAGALLKTELRGGVGNDTISISTGTNAFNLGGSLQASLDGGGGNDQLSLILILANGASNHSDLQVLGGGGNDSIDYELDFPLLDPVGQALVDGGTGADVLNNFATVHGYFTRVETINPIGF